MGKDEMKEKEVWGKANELKRDKEDYIDFFK